MDAIGVDVGGTNLGAARVGPDRTLERAASEPHPDRAYPQVVAAIAARVSALAPEPDAPVGVAVAGWLSADRETVVQAANLGWRDRPLRAELAERLARPVVICNDADAAAWGEYVLAGRPGGGPFVMLTIGTDVGGGVIVDGRLVTGAGGVGGELGHVGVDPGGPVCVCGARGCLAVYASGTAIMARARDRFGPITPDDLRARVSAHDPDGLAILDAAGAAIAVASSQIARVLDHRTLVLGGGALGLGDALVEAVQRAQLATPALGAVRSWPEVVAARAGSWSGVIGAAELARTRQVERA